MTPCHDLCMSEEQGYDAICFTESFHCRFRNLRLLLKRIDPTGHSGGVARATHAKEPMTEHRAVRCVFETGVVPFSLLCMSIGLMALVLSLQFISIVPSAC